MSATILPVRHGNAVDAPVPRPVGRARRIRHDEVKLGMLLRLWMRREGSSTACLRSRPKVVITSGAGFDLGSLGRSPDRIPARRRAYRVDGRAGLNPDPGPPPAPRPICSSAGLLLGLPLSPRKQASRLGRYALSSIVRSASAQHMDRDDSLCARRWVGGA